MRQSKLTVMDIEESWLLSWAILIPEMQLFDSNRNNQMILQWISRTYNPVYFDILFNNLEGESLGGKPLLTYNRYNVILREDELQALGFSERDYRNIGEISESDNGNNIEILNQIGRAAGKKEIKPEHFPDVFNVS